MTTVSSKLTDSLVFKHYAYNCKRNMRIWIVLIVLNAIGFPLLNLTAITGEAGILTAISILSQIAACASGIFLVYSSFDYLYNKTLVDMAFSAPLTTTQRFWSHFASGLTVYLSPYIGGSILGIIIGTLGSFTKSGKDFYSQFPVFPTMVQTMTVILLAMIMLYVMTLLVVVCCGNLFESVAYTLVLNAIIPITIVSTIVVSLSDIYGLNNEMLSMEWISVSSPIGIIIGMFYNEFGYLYTSMNLSKGLAFWKLQYLLPIMLIIAGLIVLSFFLYKKRKAEHTGRPFVFKLIYYVLLTAVTYSIIAMFMGIDEGSESFFGAIILSGIIYLIAEVITNRGFKRFGWSALRYTVTVIASAVFVVTLTATNLFGFEHRIPKVERISSIEIDYDGYYSNNGLPTANNWYGGSLSSSIRYTNAEDISIVVNLHKALVDDYLDSVDRSYMDFTKVQIRYNMKLGLPMTREYYVPITLIDMLKPLDMSNEFKSNAANIMVSNIEQSERIRLANIYYGGEQVILAGKTNPYELDKDALAKVLHKDIMEETEKDYYTPSAAPIVKLELDFRSNSSSDGVYSDQYYSYSFYIKASYKNTLAYLKEHGLSDYLASNESQEILPDELYGLFIIAPYEGMTNEKYYYTDDYIADDYAQQTKYYYETNRHYSSSEYINNENVKRLIITDKVRELLSVAQPTYRSEEPCYIIGNDYNGQGYIIPPEYSSLAEEVFASEDAVAGSQNTDLVKKYAEMGITLKWYPNEDAYFYYSDSLGMDVYVTANGEEYFYNIYGDRVYIVR